MQTSFSVSSSNLDELQSLRVKTEKFDKQTQRKLELQNILNTYTKKIESAKVLLKAIQEENQQDQKTIANLQNTIKNFGKAARHKRTQSANEFGDYLDIFTNKQKKMNAPDGVQVGPRPAKRRATAKVMQGICTNESNTPKNFKGRRENRSNTGGSEKSSQFFLKRPIRQARKCLYNKSGSRKGGEFIPSFLRNKTNK